MNNKKAKEPYCWYGERVSDLDKRSIQQQSYLKPKPNPEQDLDSIQFHEG